MNSKCYNIHNIHFKECLFENIEATYVLIMKNSSYEDNVKKQIEYFKPTRKIHIQYNSGFKECEKYSCKSKKITNTYQDLTHAYINVFKDAKKNGYKHILILEEDFIFSKDINKQCNIDTINEFLPTMLKNKYLLFLGCIPIISLKHSDKIRKNILSIGTQSVIYPESIFDDIINECHVIEDIDVYLHTKVKYMTNKPLVYQIFNNTENRTSWGLYYGYISNVITTFVTTLIFSLFLLDTQEEPGTSTLYKINVFVYDFLLPLFILLMLLNIIRTMYS
jgi:hypothetical protein